MTGSGNIAGKEKMNADQNVVRGRLPTGPRLARRNGVDVMALL